MPISDFLDDCLEHTVIRAHLADVAIIGTALDPMSPGSGADTTLVRGGRAIGVTLENGDELRATRVSSNMNVKRAFLRHVDEAVLPEAAPNLSGKLHLTDGIKKRERAYDDRKSGHFSRDPLQDVMIPTTTPPGNISSPVSCPPSYLKSRAATRQTPNVTP